MIQITPVSLDAALYLVPTPIGNREDITLRALRVLASAPLIAVEDLQAIRRLLSMYTITPSRIVRYHESNEPRQSRQLVETILEGTAVAFCSEVGMPLLSDPGYPLVKRAIDAGVKIVPLPGANAALTALVASGLPMREFVFAGFPPHGKGRRSFLERLVRNEQTVILYESPHRLVRLFKELVELCGMERQCVIARELTKMHESFYRGTIGDLTARLGKDIPIRGEFVILLQGNFHI